MKSIIKLATGFIVFFAAFGAALAYLKDISEKSRYIVVVDSQKETF